ncbi:PREDICTED: killer cell immunoglobulin-like receptor 2DL5A-like [Elephantulus edwardii]|uniref:killer cell immunoglobulin-like receptor 2DL5A-like n=1 Tax=Elephantulus edwardii TaxID=28737 RepID=UPI0003F068EA|nr:PREDICTED: killer cell immunoglobulin-like receptor 2DL5A-like [Elephantulus edwardii]
MVELGCGLQSIRRSTMSFTLIGLLCLGGHNKPTLTVSPAPVVARGERFGICMLYKEKKIQVFLHVIEKLHGKISQADFSLHVATSVLAGTINNILKRHEYFSITHKHVFITDRTKLPSCYIYGSDTHGQTTDLILSPILIGPSVVTIILVLLICFLIRRCCRAKKDATMLSREPDVDTTVSGKVPEEDPQEVTYTELRHWTPKKKNITPTPQRSEAPSTNTHVYMQVAVR